MSEEKATETTGELVIKGGEILAYNEFRSQLAQLKAHNAAVVFDYEDKKGNQEARSHVHQLRRTKGAVEATRKEQKSYFLEMGRKVDGEAKEITAELDAMIEVHDKPLKEIEQREKDRVAQLQRDIDEIEGGGARAAAEWQTLDLEVMRDRLAEIEAEPITEERWQEFVALAEQKKTTAIQLLKGAIAQREKYDADQAELERLRKETAEREQRERDERIAREAEEKARRELEEQARREQEEKDRQAREQREAEQREREAADRRRAEDRARITRLIELPLTVSTLDTSSEIQAKIVSLDHQPIPESITEELRPLYVDVLEKTRTRLIEMRDAKAADEESRRQQEAEEAGRRQREAEESRKAENKNHRAAINRKAKQALVDAGIADEVAQQVIELIARKEVPGVTIQY